jgi:hypothetical protein
MRLRRAIGAEQKPRDDRFRFRRLPLLGLRGRQHRHRTMLYSFKIASVFCPISSPVSAALK